MDNHNPTILLYGNSLLMGGLAASLAKQSQFTLQHAPGETPDLAQQLALLHPDVLIFEVSAAPPLAVCLALQAHSPCLLLGIDLKHNTLLQWIGWQTPAQTLQDVLQTIDIWARAECGRRLAT